MKNSKDYAPRLQKLYRGLKRAHSKVEKTTYDDPIEALIYGVVSEQLNDSAAQRAMKGFRSTFVDWNDLRVSRVEEIVEVLREDSTTSRATAATLTAVLRSIFDAYHDLSLEPLKKMGKRPAKKTIEDLEGVDHFAVSYCMLTALQGHAIPLTARMAEYLRYNDIVAPEADTHEIEGFLTRQVSAKDAYEFYQLLRRESESPKVSKKKKTTRKKTTKRAKVAKAKK